MLTFGLRPNENTFRQGHSTDGARDEENWREMKLKWKRDHCSCNCNLSNCKLSPKKRLSGLQRDSNPWPLRSRCSVLLRWSHLYFICISAVRIIFILRDEALWYRLRGSESKWGLENKTKSRRGLTRGQTLWSRERQWEYVRVNDSTWDEGPNWRG